MNLRKQLFTSFLMLAMLPLAAVGIYIFATNLILAFDLHEQNLRDSTQIQAELVEENINRLMVRARKFVSSQEVKRVCGDNSHRGEGTISELSDDILNFTDETLDNVAIFALLDLEGEIIYSSGSVSDSRVLKANLPTLSQLEQQLVSEIPFTDPGNSLVIYTPVQENKTAVGTLVIVCRTDYFLKLISSHRQLESSNALIYCREHHQIITSKQDVSGSLSELDLKVGEESRGGLLCKMNDQYNLAYYQSLLKTPWVLVSTVDTAQIFSKVKNYGLINIAALLTVFFIIIILSRNQSRKMLYPLDQLLGAVEEFFLNGATKFPEADIDPKTEIGYLAEKFSNLSDEMTLVQDKIRETWRNLALSYKHLEPVIDRFMPASRRDNRYCRGLGHVSDEMIRSARTVDELKGRIGDRYHKVNLEAYSRHKTVEFRQHSGTTNFTKMRNWVLFLHKLVTFATREHVPAATTLSDIPFLDSEQKLYYKLRTKKLSA